MVNYSCHCMSLHVCPGKIFVLDIRLAILGKLSFCFSACSVLPGGLFYRPFYGGGPGVSLTLCGFVVYSTRQFVLSLALFYFVIVFFSPFSIAITSLREEKANLSFFVLLFELRLFGFVCFLFLLFSGIGCGL